MKHLLHLWHWAVLLYLRRRASKALEAWSNAHRNAYHYEAKQAWLKYPLKYAQDDRNHYAAKHGLPATPDAARRQRLAPSDTP